MPSGLVAAESLQTLSLPEIWRHLPGTCTLKMEAGGRRTLSTTSSQRTKDSVNWGQYHFECVASHLGDCLTGRLG